MLEFNARFRLDEQSASNIPELQSRGVKAFYGILDWTRSLYPESKIAICPWPATK